MIHRHKAREIAFKALYSWELNKSTTFADISDIMEISSSFGEDIFNGVIDNLSTIDDILKSKLEHWDFERVSKVDLSILRMSLYSLLFQKDISRVITIDEAINLSKEYGADSSYKFVNGVLDSIVLD